MNFANLLEQLFYRTRLWATAFGIPKHAFKYMQYKYTILHKVFYCRIVFMRRCVSYLLVSIRIVKAARLKIWRYTNDIDTLCPGRNIVNTPEIYNKSKVFLLIYNSGIIKSLMSNKSQAQTFLQVGISLAICAPQTNPVFGVLNAAFVPGVHNAVPGQYEF